MGGGCAPLDLRRANSGWTLPSRYRICTRPRYSSRAAARSRNQQRCCGRSVFRPARAPDRRRGSTGVSHARPILLRRSTSASTRNCSALRIRILSRLHGGANDLLRDRHQFPRSPEGVVRTRPHVGGVRHARAPFCGLERLGLEVAEGRAVRDSRSSSSCPDVEPEGRKRPARGRRLRQVFVAIATVAKADTGAAERRVEVDEVVNGGRRSAHFP